MTGGEEIELTGAFPNCAADEVSLKVRKLGNNQVPISTQDNGSYKISGTHSLLQENQFRIQITSSSATSNNDDPRILLCKDNSEAETNSYANCNGQSKYCHCIIIIVRDNSVVVNHKSSADDTDHSQKNIATISDVVRNNGVQIDAFWNTDTNIYLFINSISDAATTSFDDLSQADVLVDRAAVFFPYMIREVGLYNQADWVVYNDLEVSTSSIDFDCATNRLTMPSMPAGSYQLKYHEASGDSGYTTDIFNFDLGFDSLSIVGGNGSNEMSLGGGATVEILGQGFGDYTEVTVCDEHCTITNHFEGANHVDGIHCSAPAMANCESYCTW